MSPTFSRANWDARPRRGNNSLRRRVARKRNVRTDSALILCRSRQHRTRVLRDEEPKEPGGRSEGQRIRRGQRTENVGTDFRDRRPQDRSGLGDTVIR